MEQSRTSKVIRTAIADVVYQGTSILFPFVIRTLFIYYLGNEYRGLNDLCASILGAISIVNLGIDSALRYQLYKPVAEKDWNSVGALLCFYRKLFYGIGAVILAVSLVILPFLSFLIKRDIPEGINIYVVFGGFILSSVLEYWCFYYLEIGFYGDQRKDIINKAHTIALLVAYSVQCVFIYKGLYYFYVISMVLVPVIRGILLKIIYKKCYPQVVLKGKVSLETQRKIWKDTFSVAVYKLRTSSRYMFDNTIISMRLGLVVLAKYNNYYTLALTPVILCEIIINSLAPSIGNYQVSNSKNKVYEIYSMTTVFLLFFAGLFCVCYFELVQPFIEWWIGAENLLGWDMVLLLTIYIFFSVLSHFFTMYRESLNVWQTGRKAAVIEMLSNLVLNVLLTYLLGLPGIVLATVLTMVFINIPIDIYVISRKHFGESVLWTFAVICATILGSSAGIAVTGLVLKVAVNQHFHNFFIRGTVCVVATTIGLVLFLGVFKTARDLFKCCMASIFKARQ